MREPTDPDLREAKDLLDLHDRRPGVSYQLLLGAVKAILRYLILRERSG